LLDASEVDDYPYAEDPFKLPPPAAPWATLIRSLGAHVKLMRLLVGFSQADLAKHAGLSQGAISRIESGVHQDIPLQSAIRILAALGTCPQLDGLVSAPLHALLQITRGITYTLGIASPLPAEPGTLTLMQTYHDLTPSHREAFLKLALPIAAFIQEKQG
jgi:transcriptional regulator with XRE-family HTH domain